MLIPRLEILNFVGIESDITFQACTLILIGTYLIHLVLLSAPGSYLSSINFRTEATVNSPELSNDQTSLFDIEAKIVAVTISSRSLYCCCSAPPLGLLLNESIKLDCASFLPTVIDLHDSRAYIRGNLHLNLPPSFQSQNPKQHFFGIIPVTFQPPQQPHQDQIQSATLVLPSDSITDQIYISGPQAFYGVRLPNNNRNNNNNNHGNRNNSRCNNNNNRGGGNGRQFDWASTQNTVCGTCNRCGIGHIPSQCPIRDLSTIRTRPSANFANTCAQSFNASAN
nr:putative ribonuclease H-like domain-containing protein [Tanacetum cinerariifolium]